MLVSVQACADRGQMEGWEPALVLGWGAGLFGPAGEGHGCLHSQDGHPGPATLAQCVIWDWLSFVLNLGTAEHTAVDVSHYMFLFLA